MNMIKIYLILFASFFISYAVNAQTITVSNVEASINDVATVKVYMTGAENCTATGFCLEFDDGLSIVGIENVKSDDFGTEEDVTFDIVVNENTAGIILIDSDSKGKPHMIYNVLDQPQKEA